MTKMFYLSLSSLFIVISCQCPSIRVSVSSTEQCATPIKHNVVLKEAMDKYSDCLDTCDCRSHPNTWTQVSHLDMTNSSQSCPSAWAVVETFNVRACGRQLSRTGSCDSVFYSTHGTKYTQVSGRIKGYQYNSPNAFESFINGYTSLDSWYIDGISLTHGRPGSRIHVWSFVNAYYETTSFNEWKCPCMLSSSSTWPYTIPVFVGENYFCATGSRNTPGASVLVDNPLWDGVGCTGDNTCCQFNQPPWFCRTLPAPTTDDLEVRICADQDTSNENIYISNLELYVK